MCCSITCIFRIEISTITKVVGLKINLTLVRKMVINLSATEAVDLVCNDVFGCKRKREGIQEMYSYRGVTTVKDKELDLLAKAVILLPVEETTSFQLESY